MEPFEITDQDLLDASGMRRKRSRPRSLLSDDGDHQEPPSTRKEFVSFVSAGSGHTAASTNQSPSTPNDDEYSDGSSSSSSDDEDQAEDNKYKYKYKPGNASTGLDKVKSHSRVYMQSGSKAIGSWEAHTTGFGSKMLQKMGWTPGEGLGADKSGVAEPVEVSLRPKKMGLAYGDRPEMSASERKKLEAQELAEEKARTESLRKIVWKKGSDGIVTYPSVEEILEQEGFDPKLAKLYTKNIVNPSKSFKRVDPIPSDNVKQHFPELQLNVKMLCDRASGMLHNVAQNLKRESDILSKCRKELEDIHTGSNTQPDKLEKLYMVLSLMKQLGSRVNLMTSQYQQNPISAASMNLYGDLVDPLQSLYRQDPSIYHLSLQQAMASLIAPIMKNGYQNWNPLMNPQLGINVLQSWMPIFQQQCQQNDERQQREQQEHAYKNMIYCVWYPTVKDCIENKWDPRQPESMINFLAEWKSVLPENVYKNVIHHLLIPKIVAAIELSNPLIDVHPLHTWIHPWLPILDQDMKLIFTAVSKKFSQILDHSMTMALKIVSPWHGVLPQRDMDNIVTTVIIPRLYDSISDLKIRPRGQELKLLEDLFAFIPMIGLKHVVDILEAAFFHRWLHTLYIWLDMPNKSTVQFQEISRWYSEWKAVFPAEVSSDPTVEGKLRIALKMMNQAMSTGSIKGYDNGLYETPIAPSRARVESRSGLSQMVSSKKATVSFRETVEHFAQKNNIVFLPTSRKTLTGEQLFKFGKLNIYLEGTVVYAELKVGQFTPVSFDQLLHFHTEKS